MAFDCTQLTLTFWLTKQEGDLCVIYIQMAGFWINQIGLWPVFVLVWHHIINNLNG